MNLAGCTAKRRIRRRMHRAYNGSGIIDTWLMQGGR